MPKAVRPRIALTLSAGEQPGDAYAQDFPIKRSWPAIAVGLFVFLAFTAALLPAQQFTEADSGDDLFALLFSLFGLFWMLGWSVAVVTIGLIVLAMLWGRESLRVRQGDLILQLGLPVLSLTVTYPGRWIRHFRAEPAPQKGGRVWRGAHLAFDYADYPVAFASHIPGDRGQAILEDLLRLFPHQDGPLPEVAAPPAEPEAMADGPAAAGVSAPISLRSPSTLALLAANLVPLLGVLSLGWQIREVMLLFWAESAVIGFYNLLKMLRIGAWRSLFLGPFFVGHYGGFMVGHLLFIYTLFGSSFPAVEEISVSRVLQDFQDLAPALLAFVVSHGLSFFVNFIGRREYRQRSLKQQMGEPYRRILIMHVTIILGGFMALAMASSLPALVLLVVLKVSADLWSHLKEHRGRGEDNVEESSTPT